MKGQFSKLQFFMIIFFATVNALNKIKGNLFDQFGNIFLQEDEQIQEQTQLSNHEQAVDQASKGVITSNIWCEQCQLNNIKITEKLIGETLSVNIIQGQKSLENPDLNSVIYVLGDINISDKKSEDEESNLNINLIQSKSVSINGVKQWTLIDSESFSFTKSLSNSTLLQNGWKVIKSDQSQSSLKTNDEQMAQATLNEKITKKFEELPDHSHIKIEANFYFLSPFWKGQSAQIRINQKIAWLDSHKWTENLTSEIQDICQLQITDVNQFIWVQPISFVVKHSISSFEIELGLTKSINEILECNDYQDKLELIPLFGFDDFQLFIK